MAIKVFRGHQYLVSPPHTGRDQRQMQCGSPGVDTDGVADAQVIGDIGLKLFDEWSEAKAAGREQSADIGASRVRDLVPLLR